jgi:NADH:ubiquinone oxidoreductase subunit E
VEVECLGACSNGPMIQINNDFFEDLDENSTKEIIQNIKNGTPNKIGSQKGRKSSENA